MASEDTLIGNDFRFQVGNGASPEVFSDFCAVVDPGAIGEEKALIDVTSLCDSARTYRGGLPDGASIPLKCNFIPGDTASHAMKQSYDDNTVRNYRLMVEDSSPSEYFEFAAIVTAWSVAIPSGDKSSITFTLKVSGQVTWVHS